MTRCPNCGTITGAPEWKARSTYLWSNQYGQGKRVFCDECGQWTDVTLLYKGDLTTWPETAEIVIPSTDNTYPQDIWQALSFHQRRILRNITRNYERGHTSCMYGEADDKAGLELFEMGWVWHGLGRNEWGITEAWRDLIAQPAPIK